MGRIIVVAIAVLGLAFLLIPLLIILAVSVTETEYLVFPPVGMTFRWYTEFMQDSDYMKPFLTSGILAVASTVLALLIAVPSAFALNRSTFRGRQFLSGLFLSPLILPGIVIGAGILQLFSAFKAEGTFAALLAGHVVVITPYIIRTTLSSLANMTTSTEEAARDLGAGGPTTFFLVTLPTIKPGIITGALFAAIISWVNVEVSMFNTTARTMTLPVKLYNDVQFQLGPVISAVSATTIVVAVVLVVLMDAFFGLARFAVGEDR